MNHHSGHHHRPHQGGGDERGPPNGGPHHHHHGQHQQQQLQRQHHGQQQQQQQQGGVAMLPNGAPAKWHSYKMLVDPMIHRGAPKMMRYDGLIVPGNPHHIPPTLTDPRNRLPKSLWQRMEAMDLPVPRFKIDENYIGEPPKLEVTLENMNDNINKQFLRQMVEKFGTVEEIHIYFHPVSSKHLGLGHLVFEEVKSAKDCVKSLHGKSVMGQQLNCYLDPLGKSCTKMFTELTEEKKPEPVPEPSPPEPPPPPVISQQEQSPQADGGVDMDNYDDSEYHSHPHHRSNSRDFHRRESRDSRDGGGRHHRDRDRERGRYSREHSRNHRDSRDSSFSQQQQSHERHYDNFTSGVNPADDQHYQPSRFNQADPRYWQEQAERYASQQTVEDNSSVMMDKKEPDVKEDSITERLTNSIPDQLQSLMNKVEKDEGGDVVAALEDGEDGGDSDDHKVDLDTRLKMLMKGQAGAMPAFLLDELAADASDDEDDKEMAEINNRQVPDPRRQQNGPSSSQVHQQQQQQQQQRQELEEPKPFEEWQPLSRPPSPFLTRDQYLSCHQDWQHERQVTHNIRLQRILRAKALAAASAAKEAKANNDDDRMSLSSLSSAENNILEQGPGALMPGGGGAAHGAYHNAYGYYPPHQAGYPGEAGQWYQQQHPEGFWPPGYDQQQPQFDKYGRPLFNPASQYYDDNQWNSNWTSLNYVKANMTGGKSDRNLVRPIIAEAVQVIVNELNATLRKDINKKICETFAFSKFDKWWQDEETKYKEKHSTHTSKTTSKSSTSSATAPSVSSKIDSSVSSNIKKEDANKMPRIPRAEDISTLFDKHRENMETSGGKSSGFGGSLGFGFRGSIPKLPAFKRKPLASEKSSKDSRDRDRDRDRDRRDRGRDRDHRGDKDKKRGSEKRREQERRREERLAEKDRDRKKDSAIDKDEASTSKTKSEPSKRKKTLDDIYDMLYPKDEDDLSDESKESDYDYGGKKSGKSSDKADSKKRFTKKKGGSSSSAGSTIESRTSISGSSSSDDDEVISPPKKKQPSKTASTAAIVQAKLKRDEKRDKTSTTSSSVTSSSSSSTSSSSSASSASSKSSSSSSATSEEDDAVASGSEKAAKDVKKKPVPMRRASEPLNKIKEEEDDKDAVAAPPAVPEEVGVKPEPEPEEPPSHIADHCYAKPRETKVLPPGGKENKAFESGFANDHGYTRPRTPPAAGKSLLAPKQPKAKAPPAKKARVEPPLPPPKPVRRAITFKERAKNEELKLVFKFLTNGIDLEDINYLKMAYKTMLERPDLPVDISKMLNFTTWVDHSVTQVPDPPKRKRKDDYSKPHLTGSCRTEGYYKMDPREKKRTKFHLQRQSEEQGGKLVNLEGAVTKAKMQTAQSMSREARSTQRRQLAILGDEVSGGSDLLKFNQLKFRRKNLTFGKSAIHDWGLFAREYIGADEMVIEYVGHVVRPVLSDVREKRYEKQGIGSSYLFRIDQDYVVDATKKGNLARFINHSCDPNCYAKIITIDGEKKIVIYSKQPIAFGEEITYDYKFPIEDEKIHCLCGSKNCRKYLN